MKKLAFFLFLLLCAVSAQAAHVLPKTVQGIPYAQTLPELRSDMSFEDRTYTAAPDGQFTFDMIESWAGEGANQAALVIQWNTGKDSEKTALVFGYRWDGVATGADMVRAVVSANPRLYGLIQYTNVSSPTDPNGGYTINGFGWDVDEAGPIQLRDTGDKTVPGGKIYDSADGLFIHPRGYVPGQGGSSSYDYDDWEAVDPNDYWKAGWFTNGFWSYWVKGSTTAAFSFSSWGASARVLTDGCWDGWNFENNFVVDDWKPFEAAPSPIPAGAKTEFTVDGLCYTLKNYTSKTVVVAAPFTENGKPVAEYSGDVVIPASFTFDGVQYNVVGISDGAFQGSKVTKVVLPSTVTSIGKMAFEGSTLSDINVTDAIKSIGDYAFMGCPIKAPFFPAGVTEVAEGTYYGTAVTSAVIPGHVAKVGDNAFAACGQLTEVSVPKTVNALGQGVFADCDALVSVTVDATYPMAIDEGMFSDKAYAHAVLNVPSGFKSTYAKASGWSKFVNVKEFLIDVNVGDKFALDGVTYVITAVGDNAAAKVSYCNVDGKVSASSVAAANKVGYTGALTIPAQISYQDKTFNVTELNDSAFYGASELTGVTLPKNVTVLPKHVFNGCGKLTGVNIPDAVNEIGEYAFYNCAALENLVLPAGLQNFGRYAFSGCTVLKDVAIPTGIKVIPQYAFKGCAAIESMILSDNVKSVEMYAFSGCTNLKNVKLPAGLTELPQALFEKCASLVSVDVPATVIKTGNYVFDGCSSLNMEIPQQLKTIGPWAFRNCTSLKSATVPPAITTIPNYMFSGCTALEQVTMSDAVTQIGSYAFQKCTALRTIKIAENADADLTDGCKLPASLKNIMTYAFQNCAALKLHPDMPVTLTQFGNYAFDGMTLMTAVNLPEGFKTFGQYSFRNTKLSEIVVPKSVTNISVNYAFVGCPVVYITNPVPGSIYTNTFKQTSSTYVKVVVPSGTKAAFDGKSIYWKNSKVVEPELTVAFDKSEAVAMSNGADITAEMSVDYADATVPVRFRQANADNLKSGSVKVLYKVADGAEAMDSVEATVDSHNAVKVQLAGLQASTKYVYNWLFTLGSIESKSGECEFTTMAQTTGVNDINGVAQTISYADGVLTLANYEGYAFTVCDLAGLVYGTVGCNSDVTSVNMSLKAGVYVVYGKSDTSSVTVKILVK